jgi:hypothetical protein
MARQVRPEWGRDYGLTSDGELGDASGVWQRARRRVTKK